jgi:hypothetical protein
MEPVTAAASIAVVTGLTQVLKGVMGDTRFAPLIALILGVAIAFLITPTPGLREVILDGIITGLSSMGLYSGSKTVKGIISAPSGELA